MNKLQCLQSRKPSFEVTPTRREQPPHVAWVPSSTLDSCGNGIVQTVFSGMGVEIIRWQWDEIGMLTAFLFTFSNMFLSL